MELELGKLPATYDKRDLRFVDFKSKTVALKQAPVGFATARVEKFAPGLTMMGNGPAMPEDAIPANWTAAQEGAGDCVWADAGNRVKYSNALAGKNVDVRGKECIEMYAKEVGYNPVTGDNDNGTDMRSALNYARKTGIIDSTGTEHKIGGYCSLTPGNWTEMLEALAIFDMVCFGIQFRGCYMDQFNAGKPWNYVRSSPVEGGHDILCVDRNHTTEVDVFTWAKVQGFMESVYTHDCDEAYGIFLPETLTNGVSPEGFHLADFTAALAEL
jgi:hypothetical protein